MTENISRPVLRVYVLVIAWAVPFLVSFGEPPGARGGAHEHGLNTLVWAIEWQLIALALALLAWASGRSVPELARGTRWTSRVPLLGELAVALFVIGTISLEGLSK